MEYYRSEIKTGIMVVVCIFILLFVTFFIGGSKMFGGTYDLYVVYKNIGGLTLDAPIYFAGLKAGKVKAMRILTKSEKEKYPGNSVMVNIILDNLVNVKKDSKIAIKTLGFMGLRYIDITPGAENAEVITPDSIVMGETAQDINEVMVSVGQIIDQIKPRTGSIMAGIDNIVGENGSLQTTIVDLQKFVNDADDVIVINKDDIQKIISNLSAATESLKGFADDIKKHPWKLLIKSSDKPQKKEKTSVVKEQGKDVDDTVKTPKKSNFSARRR